MYLLDVQTFKLKYVIGVPTPAYAILSHRWTSEELTFSSVYKNRVAHQSKGYQKVLGACRTAAKYDVAYLWVDTCCIDKRSSAELSEAINSMYSWYERAEICIVYLEDGEVSEGVDYDVTDSVWFTRSWTLQELIAPRRLEFYDTNWTLLGDRNSKAAAIEARTGLSDLILTKKKELWEISIAERMSWASDRQATRPEDIAYSLMGIFDVSMPLLYGEGSSKAFLRLQEEIVRRSCEPTFLLWGLESIEPNLFASSPADFRDIRNIRRDSGVYCSTTIIPFELTNLGLNIEASLIRYEFELYGAIVGCSGDDKVDVEYVVLLREFPCCKNTFYRVGVAEVDSFLAARRTRKITILRSTPDQRLEEEIERNEKSIAPSYSLHIRSNLSFPIRPIHYDSDKKELRDETDAYWYPQDSPTELHCAFRDPLHPGIARLRCDIGDSKALWLEFSFDFDSRPCLLLRFDSGRVQSFMEMYQPSVFQISDGIQDKTKVVGFHGTQREIKLWDVVDEVSGQLSYFFRSSALDCFAKLPTPGIDGPIYIRFLRPLWDENPHWTWLLSFSSTHPHDTSIGHRQGLHGIASKSTGKLTTNQQ